MSVDLYHLSDASYRTQVFYSSGTWVKPKGISMVQITVAGAGGGGGGGCCKGTTLLGCGGGGGASGGLSRITIPAVFLTEELIVNVGIGGSGGTAGNTSVTGGTAGGTGGNTTVDMSNGSGTAPTLLAFASGGGGGGGGITIGAAGTAGASTAAPNSQQFLYAALGNSTTINQQPGTAGGTNLNAGILTYLAIGNPFCGGTGGGGSGSGANNSPGSGGNIIGAGFGRSIAASGANTRGTDGYFLLSPFVSYGGTGGGSSSNAVPYLGYAGGNGNVGSGGGGGGTGINLSSGSGGAGGKGGDGMVVINCW